LNSLATAARTSSDLCVAAVAHAAQPSSSMSDVGDMDDDGFPGGPQQVAFWSLEIPPNKTVHARLSELPGM
jgi:hypothetical protein